MKGDLQAGIRVGLLCGPKIFALSRVAPAQQPKGYSHRRGWKPFPQSHPTAPLRTDTEGQRRFPATAGQCPVQGRWKVGPCTPLTPGEGPGPEHEPSGARPEELAQLGAASWQREAPASSGSQRGRQRLHARPVEPRLRWWPRRLGVALSALWGDHFRHR